MIRPLKYFSILLGLFLLINALSLLLAKRYLIEKGKITITLTYQCFKNEDLSIYWNGGAGFSDQNHLTQKTRIDQYQYKFQIKDLDSLVEIRIDPDSDFDLALLKQISIEGLFEPLLISRFDKITSNGLMIYNRNDQTLLQRKKTNSDPYLLISIPIKNRSISSEFTFRDSFILLLCLVFSSVIFLLIKPKIQSSITSLKLSQIALISLFIMITGMYWINLILHFYNKPPSIENRVLATKPNSDSLLIQPKKYFSSYTEWFSDHLAFKQFLVYLNSNVKLRLFNSSPMPESMYIGKNFEFFSANSLLTDDVTGKRRLSQEELKSLFANSLNKQKQLALQNISYYLTIPPSKQTVYEDLLPDYLLLQKKSGKMTEQFFDEIKSKKANFYIDVISLLKSRHQQFPKERVFYQYDLHWSDWGAFLAYGKLIDRIKQDHPWIGNALTESEISIDTLYSEDADLAKLILMNKKYKKEKYIIKSKTDSITETVVNGVYQFPIYKYKNEKAKGKVLVFRDSYSEQWKWLIARHFKESVFIWDQTITQKLIDEYQPDIVIQENCEMFLFYLFNPFKEND